MAAVGDARKRLEERRAAAAQSAEIVEGEPGPIELEVRCEVDPAGRLAVVLQQPSGWVSMDAVSARALSDMLTRAADAVEARVAAAPAPDLDVGQRES